MVCLNTTRVRGGLHKCDIHWNYHVFYYHLLLVTIHILSSLLSFMTYYYLSLSTLILPCVFNTTIIRFFGLMSYCMHCGVTSVRIPPALRHLPPRCHPTQPACLPLAVPPWRLAVKFLVTSNLFLATLSCHRGVIGNTHVSFVFFTFLHCQWVTARRLLEK